MDFLVNQLLGDGSWHMHHNSEGEDCRMYRHIIESIIYYYKEQRFRFFMLQLENVRLEQVEQLHAEEQIRKNSQAEEQIRKLKDEIQRKAIENMNLAVKLREAEHKVCHGADYVYIWKESVLDENRSECSTRTLEAALEG